MTPTELTELDRMLALCVMGWEFLPYVVRDDGGYWVGTGFDTQSWHPTSDIAQAMMVAEKITRLELFHSKKYNSWHAKFPCVAFEVSSSASLAIALAAQAWLAAQPTGGKQ